MKEATRETIDYAPVSRLAVAAAVAGAASALALATPLLWVLPLVGMALAIAGLSDVARTGKAGRAVALAGLALSVGFGVQAVTMKWVSRRITEGRAAAVARLWLDAVRDDRLSDALGMLGPGTLPMAPHDHDHAGPDAHGPEEKESLVARLAELPAVRAVRGCGGAATPSVRCTGMAEDAEDVWETSVRLTPCASGGDVVLLLQMAPSPAVGGRDAKERWRITRIEAGP